ncbi:MAG: ATP-dependent Clp protease ATP-binding subunit [Acidobacteria bacterium]|nr:MAG: ATP-dependent Clp protease ATP-binding subunit [Acidobacteriota bacterium]
MSKTGERIILDPNIKSSEAQDFEDKLSARVVGQERAVRRIASLYQIYLSGMASPGRPIGNLLFLGPTGSGKTRVVEAAAEILFGDSKAAMKIDCAEFQHSHEIAKLIGSPPGYLGHRETPPLLTQEAIDQYHTDKIKLTFLLFDEIEKANDALWQLLLGILDKATLTLGDNRRVDLSKTIVFMTSNLGASEMSEFISGGIGFAPPAASSTQESELDQKIYKTALEASKRKFSPEFMNRIDKVVVFQTLQPVHLNKILDIELGMVQERILNSRGEGKFIFKCTPQTKEFLLKEGTDLKYGARHLKRALERYLVYPLSNLVATNQVTLGDLVRVDFDNNEGKLVFLKEEGGAIIQQWENPEEARIFEEIFSKNASAIRESKTESKAAKPSAAKERRG